MLTTQNAVLMVIVIAFVTFLTRVLPFIIFPGSKQTPPFITWLGKVLPCAVMGMLVIYCLKSVSILTFPYGIPELIAIVLVILVHKWKHNLLLSIVGGTVVYMLLVQLVFVM